MRKGRLAGLGAIGLAATAACGLVAFPSTRYALEREWVRHAHGRFSTARTTDVVPVAVALPPAPPGEADPRFLARADADQPAPRLVPPRLDAAGFGPPSVAAGLRSGTGDGALDADATAAGARPAPGDDGEVAVDLAGARLAMQAYRMKDLAAGDDFARPTTGALRTLLDWAAIRLDARGAGLPRLEAFARAHPDWPALPWVRRRIEEFKANTKDVGAVLALFAAQPPTTLFGRMQFAKALMAAGQAEAGAAVVRAIWRDDELSGAEESALLKDFGAVLRKEDHQARADRFLYREDVQPALRAAGLAGPDVVLLERAKVAVIASAPSDAAFAAVPKPLQADPGLAFARVQKARRANRIAEAAKLLLAAPTDPALLIDGDAWWVERRLVARKLLDAGDARTAYRICAGHSATSVPLRVEAEFHAGWIALRFLGDPRLAAPHFAAAARIAETPISVSRATYWQGRAARAAGDAAAAQSFFAAAAAQPTTFYGQLAAGELGEVAVPVRAPVAAAPPGRQREGTRAVGILLALGERELATGLALLIAKSEADPEQVAAVAQAVAASGDARATLQVGKAAAQRGLALDEAAFPTFGIPPYQPLANSADRSTVYAIARQESEFDQRSTSSAGARGLMQLITATARRTAEQAGVDYSDARLIGDAAFNAQIGAAHLGRLLADQGGSYILTFAAYNAGAGKVADWITAYGDPRKPGVDPIDWIERIPFTETRNYVQRVFENMQTYRARLGQPLAQLSGAARQAQAAGGRGT